MTLYCLTRLLETPKTKSKLPFLVCLCTFKKSNTLVAKK